MKKIVFILILSISILSCKEDCDECFTPPNPIYIVLVDKVTGENLITNGTIQMNDIVLVDELNSNLSVEFQLITEDNLNRIEIYSIGWETKITDIKCSISGDYKFNFYIDAERKKDDCCSYTNYNEISISGSEYELIPETGVYKVKIEM